MLKHWHEQANGGQRVFESRTGFKSAWALLLKRAQVADRCRRCYCLHDRSARRTKSNDGGRERSS